MMAQAKINIRRFFETISRRDTAPRGARGTVKDGERALYHALILRVHALYSSDQFGKKLRACPQARWTI